LIKNCNICNIEFNVIGNKKYCSPECLKKHKQEWIERKFKRNSNKNCVICNKIFLGNKTKKLCSDECKTKAQLNRNKKWGVKNISYLRKKDLERYHKYKSNGKAAIRVKNYYLKNREKNKIIAKKPENVEKKRKIYRWKYHNNLQFRLRTNIGNQLSARLKKNQIKKNDKLVNFIGCSIPELMLYLENKFKEGMTWQNHGYGEGYWVIDHIYPVSKFDLTKKEHLYKCWHFTNLQPLWWRENLDKYNKILVDIKW
jgi:predicted nucleic acid-binding Zn ribbon protein